jgi:hypothetical protein
VVPSKIGETTVEVQQNESATARPFLQVQRQNATTEEASSGAVKKLWIPRPWLESCKPFGLKL